MKRVFLLLFSTAALPCFVACTESSSSDAPVTTAPSVSASATPAPSASASSAPSASAAPTAKPTSGAPSSLPFCKANNFASEPLTALCAMGQDWSKSHVECKNPLPVNFCADLSEWGCSYTGVGAEVPPKVTFDARFVRPGVELKPGEMIDDNTLRARFPRAGVTRGVSVHQKVSGKDEGLKVVAAQTKKLVDAGCVVTQTDAPGSNHLDCGTWQAHVWYIDANTQAVIDADMPTSPVCPK